MGIEQHLVALLPVRTQHEGPAVAELELRDLQLHLLTADPYPVFAPVELEGLAGRKHQRHEGLARCRQQALVLGLAPATGKGRHAAVGTRVPHRHQADMHLPHAYLLLAWRRLVAAQHRPQLLGIRVELAGAAAFGILRLDLTADEVLGDGVARKLGTPGNLPDRHLLAQMPAADEAQNVHLDHSW